MRVPPLLERIFDVLEEQEPEHDVLVLGGVHVVAKEVRSFPEFPLETETPRRLAGVAHPFSLVCHRSQLPARVFTRTTTPS